MASNAQKTPIARTTPQFVQKQINRALQKLGGGLPGHVVSVGNNLVTIAFDVSGLTIPQVRMPWSMAEYVRLPIQVGDKGVAIPGSKYYIGSASGIGTGIGGRTVQGNLSSLVWFPITNKNWAAVDGDAVVIYPPGMGSILSVAPPYIEMDTPAVNATENLSVGNGWSGVFTTPTGQTVTVQAGIIINVA